MDPIFNIPEGQFSPEDWLSVPFTTPPVSDAQWVEWDASVWSAGPGSASDASHSPSSKGDGNSQNNVSNQPAPLDFASPAPSQLIWPLGPCNPQDQHAYGPSDSPPAAIDACKYRDRSPTSTTTCTSKSSPAEASSGSAKTTTTPIPHVTVEKKYRHGMVAMFGRLREAVPALNVPAGDVFADGTSARPTKAKILAGAIDHIKKMEAERERLRARCDGAVAENERLRRAMGELEGRLGLPRCGVFSAADSS